MNPLVHFEIHADDMERAKNFYKDALGWQFQEWPMEGSDPYIAVMTKEGDTGINGGLLKRPEEHAAAGGRNAFVCTAQVANYDETAKKILAAGGKEAMAKFAIPGMAWQGYFIDTEGNTFGIHQPDTNAK